MGDNSHELPNELPDRDDCSNESLDQLMDMNPADRTRRELPTDRSLMFFVKKRAKPGSKQFVDVTTLAPVTAPHCDSRGVKVANEVFNPQVSEFVYFLEDNFEEQLKNLNDAKYGATAKQLLLTQTLPRHDYQYNIGAIADCLSADSFAVKHDAACRLERIMVVTKHSAIKAAKNQFLEVARKTHQVITELEADPLTRDNDHFRQCGHLHIVAMCALLCRAKHSPSLEECRSFMTWPKLKRKQSGNDVEQEVLKLMHAFYEQLEKRMLKQKPKLTVPVCTDRKMFAKASFHEQITTFFLFLNQVAEEEWREKGKELLVQMIDLYESIKDGKRLKPEAKAGLDTLLIRSLVTILSTTFAKVRQQVGEGGYDHPQLAANLLASVVGRVSQRQLKDQNLLTVLSTVAFHECLEVRSVVTRLLEKAGHPPLQTAVDHLEAAISVADFHVDPLPRGTGASGSGKACSWHVLNGRFGQEMAECSVFVHAQTCESKMFSSSDCVDRSMQPEFGDAQRHRQNMELLAKLSSHNFLKLVAFQLTPFLFYATEHVKGRRLLENLINHRTAHRWLNTAILCHIMHDITTGLEYLASRHIASRDVTAFDMMVEGKSRRGGCAGQLLDILTTEDFTVKLTNFGLAHYFRESDEKEIRPVKEQGAIPLLWTPPEALRKGEYSEKSMVYSAGCVMYELWTHGCQPFTTCKDTTSDTVRMMLLMPDSVPLIHWPCIPDDVYDVMSLCTSSKPNARPNLLELKQTFMEMHSRKMQENPCCCFEKAEAQIYPSFSDDQIKRKHVPKRGIPPEIQQIIDASRTNDCYLYRNIGAFSWEHYPASSPAGAANELNSPYWTDIAYFEEYTSVRERFTRKFAKEELPLLESSQLPGLTDWLKSPDNQPSLEEDMPNHIVHERRYRPSWTLQDTACKGLLSISESGYIVMSMDRFVHVLLALSRAVHTLHAAGWLHRDIRASNVLVDCGTGLVSLVRLGRMCHLGSGASFTVEEPFQDALRWLAPEVLYAGQYRRESDVFMLGTVFWEVFWSREITANHPTATEINYLPFADHEKSQIANLVNEGKALPKPAACPEWLYQLSIKCRHVDPAMRPTTEAIIDTLEKELIQKMDSYRAFLPHPKLLDALHCNRRSSAEEPIPEIPARFRPRPATPFRDSCLEYESISVSRDSTLNLSPINHSVVSRFASGHEQTSKSKYLTPLSEEAMAALESWRQTVAPTRKELGQAPRRCRSGAEFGIPRESGQSGQSDSVDTSTGANTHGVRRGLTDRPHGLLRGRVTRNVPGLGSDPPPHGTQPRLGISVPLPPLPTQKEEYVYHKIKDQPSPENTPRSRASRSGGDQQRRKNES